MGLYKFYALPGPNYLENSGEKMSFSSLFSLEKWKSLLRPNFSGFLGSGKAIFLYGYFWYRKCCVFASILRKIGSGQTFFSYRPHVQEKALYLLRMENISSIVQQELQSNSIIHSTFRCSGKSVQSPLPSSPARISHTYTSLLPCARSPPEAPR